MDVADTVKKIFLLFMFGLCAVVAFFGLQWFSQSVEQVTGHNRNVFSADIQVAASQISLAPEQSAPADINREGQIENLQLPVTAASAVQVLPNNAMLTLFDQQSQTQTPIASLTKLMTALVVLDDYDLNQKVTIDAAAMAQEGEQGELREGQVLSVKDLLYIALIESSNKAAFALAEVASVDTFVIRMNQKAAELGMTETHFVDPTGLSEDSVSSAHDVTLLAKRLFEQYPLFREIISYKDFDLYSEDGSLHHKLINTNRIWQSSLMGGKTGWTVEAQGCFVLFGKTKTSDSYIVYVVLGAKDREAEMQKLLAWVKMAYGQ